MDELTKLQDLIGTLGKHFQGLVEQNLKTASKNEENVNSTVAKETEEESNATNIIKLVNDINVAIDVLPGVERTETEQVKEMETLQHELEEAENDLRKTVVEAETVIKNLRLLHYQVAKDSLAG